MDVVMFTTLCAVLPVVALVVATLEKPARRAIAEVKRTRVNPSTLEVI